MYNCIKKILLSKLLFGSTKNFQPQRKFCYYLSPPLKVKLRNVSLDRYVMHLEDEYMDLKKGTTHVSANPQQLHRLKQLEPVIGILEKRSKILKELDNLSELLEDDDEAIIQLAEEERQSYENQVKQIEEDLVQTLMVRDGNDDRNAIMLEVNTGVGGQEAMLFAKELFYMYCNFAQYRKWNVDIISYLSSDTGGIRHATALIKGNDAFKYFKHEAGVHRVQRIPVTEKMGRVHTSTVSVLVLPEPTEIEIQIDNKDLRIETKRASGAGGQHVNTTDSAVRITHIPSGVSVECQTDRSQIANKKVAMQKLRAVLYDNQLKIQNDKIDSTRKAQVKSNFRNEKIRTYNFPQDRITDHRLDSGNIHNLKTFLNGREGLQGLMEKLYKNDKIERLLDLVLRVNK